MIKIESDTIKCPGCHRPVYADIYETEGDTNLPTEYGFHVFCTDDLLDDDICTLNYDEGITLQKRVYQWLCFNLRKLPVK